MDRERAAVLGGFGGPTAVIVALLLLGGGGNTPSVVSPVTAAPAPRESADERAEREARQRLAGARFVEGARLLDDFFGDSLRRVESRCRAQLNPVSGVRCPGAEGRMAFRVIIASVPDPYDSYLDWAYDADVEALRRAFAIDGYVAHSHWLPGRKDTIEVGGHKLRRLDHDPGVMLFRRATPDSIGLALLYLVPELPSTGVHIGALRTAFGERRAILAAYQTVLGVSERERQELTIVGPMFSGSAQSLRMAIDEELDGSAPRALRPRVARVLTGSATSPSNRRVLHDTSSRVVVRRDVPARGEATLDTAVTRCDTVPRIAFSAVLNSSGALQQGLDELQSALGLKPHQVVILAESGTEYGYEQSGPALGAADRAATGATGARDAPASPLVISFPASIAGLRGEFGERLAEQQRAASMSGLDAMARSKVNLSDSLRPRERPPNVSRLTHSASDVVFAALVRAVSEHNVRLVVIHSTDVRDKLWLADEIRRRVRDIAIATFESNALLLRPEFATAFRGGIVISSFPLLPEAHFWASTTRDQAGRPVVSLGNLAGFTSDDAFGVFNATLEALGANPSLKAASRLPGAWTGHTYNRPPVWTNVIARGTLYPLRASVPPSGHWRYFGRLAEPIISPTTSVARGREHDHSYAIVRASVNLLVLVPSILVLLLTLAALLRHPTMGAFLPQPTHLIAFPRSGREAVILGLLIGVLAVLPLPMLATIGSGYSLATADFDTTPNWSILFWLALVISTPSLLAAALFVTVGVAGVLRESVPPVRRQVRDGIRTTFGNARAEMLRQRAFAQWREVGSRLDRFLGPIQVQASPVPPIADGSSDHLDGPMPRSTVEMAVVRMHKLEVATEFEMEERRNQEDALSQSFSVDEEGHAGRLVVSCLIAAAGVVFVLATGTFAVGIADLEAGGGIDATMFVFRALHLTSGVSPLVPLLLISVGSALWLWWMLQQMRDMERDDPMHRALLLLRDTRSLDTPWWRFARGLSGARHALQWLVPNGRIFLVAWAGILSAILVARNGWLPTLERLALPDGWTAFAFDVALMTGLIAIPAVVALAATRLILTWRSLKIFLDECASTPLKAAVGRLPEHLRRISQLGLTGDRRSVDHVTLLQDEYWQRVEEAVSPLLKPKANAPDALDPELSASPAEKAAAEELITQLRTRHRTDRVGRLRDNLLALCTSWDQLARPRNAATATQVPNSQPLITHALHASEEFAALLLVQAVEPILHHLQRLSLFLLVTLMTCVILTSTYPFQPESVFAVVSVVLLIVTVGSILVVMFDMNRDQLLSAMTGTTPGSVTWDTRFVTNLITIGVLPLVTFASSQFPTLRTTLFSWADPLLRLITKN